MTHNNETTAKARRRLYNKEDAATYMGMSRSNFRRLYEKENPLPTVRIGQRDMYDVNDLDTEIEKNKKPAQE